MPCVFISYVHENDVDVDRLCEDLENYGIQVWRDKKDIKPGERWKRALQHAIEGGDFFIGCFSSEYWHRDRSVMNQELRWALEQMRLHPLERLWFIPVLLNDCEVPDFVVEGRETLKAFQYVELQKGWNSGLRDILRTIDPDGATLRNLIAILEDENQLPAKRIYAAHCLGMIQSEAADAIPALIRAMSDKNGGLRATATLSLGLIGRMVNVEIPELLNALRDPLEEVQEAADFALTLLGTTGLKLIAKWYDTGDDATRVLAVRALLHLKSSRPSALTMLVEALNDESTDVRTAAAVTLSVLDEKTLNALLGLLDNGTIRQQRYALLALELCKDELRDDVIARIGECLRAPAISVRLPAAATLVGHGAISESSIQVAIDVISNKYGESEEFGDIGMRGVAFRILEDCDTELGRQTLIEVLSRQHPSILRKLSISDNLNVLVHEINKRDQSFR